MASSRSATRSVDEPLLEVSTDKVDTEIPSPVAGVLGDPGQRGRDRRGGVGARDRLARPQPATAPEPEAAPAQSAPAPAPEAPHQRRHPWLHLRLPRPAAAASEAFIRWRLRHPDRAQAGQREGSRSVNRQGHRRRRPDPQAGRTAAASAKATLPAAPAAPSAPAAKAPAAPQPNLHLRGRTEPMSRLRKVIATPHGRVAGGLRAVDHRH